MVCQRFALMVGGAGVMVCPVGGVLSAQAPQLQLGTAPAGMAERLTEVRAPRADLNQAAGASSRMQRLVARVSRQAQRVNTVGRQLTNVTA